MNLLLSLSIANDSKRARAINAHADWFARRLTSSSFLIITFAVYIYFLLLRFTVSLSSAEVYRANRHVVSRVFRGNLYRRSERRRCGGNNRYRETNVLLRPRSPTEATAVGSVYPRWSTRRTPWNGPSVALSRTSRRRCHGYACRRVYPGIRTLSRTDIAIFGEWGVPTRSTCKALRYYIEGACRAQKSKPIWSGIGNSAIYPLVLPRPSESPSSKFDGSRDNDIEEPSLGLGA